MHNLEGRAKLLGVAGFVTAALAAPVRPGWALLGLAILALLPITLARVPGRVLARRLAPIALAVGLPLALSRLGAAPARLAGEALAAKSLLAAASLIALTASTQPAELLEALGRLRMPAGLVALSEFILRGVHLLADEVIRTHRAAALRAPTAGTSLRLQASVAASVSLLGRAAARSERVGAAMALRGFDGRLPAPAPAPLPASHWVAGAGYALLSLLIAGGARWA